MATELRRIFFDPAELLEATQSYLRANVEIIGAVTVVSVKAGKDGSLAVGFVRPTQPGQPQGDITLQPEQALDLLVRFCLENNIPMPRQGTKAAVACGDSIALQIKLGNPQTAEAFDTSFKAQAVQSDGKVVSMQ